MSTATATKKQGRPARSQERAEAEALARIATLAAHALRVPRDHGGEYPSENQLRSWLTDSGTAFTIGEIKPALDLLESAGMLLRAAVGRNTARSGRISEHPVTVSQIAPYRLWRMS